MKRKPWSFPLDDASSPAVCSCEGDASSDEHGSWPPGLNVTTLWGTITPRWAKVTRHTLPSHLSLSKATQEAGEKKEEEGGVGTKERIALKENFTPFGSIRLSKVPVNSGLRNFSGFLLTCGWADDDWVFILGQTVPLNVKLSGLIKNGWMRSVFGETRDFYLHVATFSNSLLDSFLHSLLRSRTIADGAAAGLIVFITEASAFCFFNPEHRGAMQALCEINTNWKPPRSLSCRGDDARNITVKAPRRPTSSRLGSCCSNKRT